LKASVLHSERIKDALGKEFSKAGAGGAGDQHAEDFGATVVEPAFAGLVDERQRAIAPHQFVRRERREYRPRRKTGFRNRLLNRITVRKHGIMPSPNLKVSKSRR
jgi:hypothetical protein